MASARWNQSHFDIPVIHLPSSAVLIIHMSRYVANMKAAKAITIRLPRNLNAKEKAQSKWISTYKFGDSH